MAENKNAAALAGADGLTRYRVPLARDDRTVTQELNKDFFNPGRKTERGRRCRRSASLPSQTMTEKRKD
jgi:hypothetical protein